MTSKRSLPSVNATLIVLQNCPTLMGYNQSAPNVATFLTSVNVTLKTSPTNKQCRCIMADQNEKSKGVKASRRGFMKGAALVTGGTIVGVGAAAVPLSGDKVLEMPYPDVPENAVTLPNNGKTVVIIGGGLAGLQAGVELSARGFRVTVLERSGTPGGKCKAWRDKKFGPEDDPAKREPGFPGYVREHGTHAVWGFYNNLREFMGRYGWRLMDMPKEGHMYNFVDKDGAVSHLTNSRMANPYDKAELLADAFKMGHLRPEERKDFIRLAIKLMTFDYADPKQREYMDSMTFAEYCQKLGIPDRITNTICNGLLEMAYFDKVQTASAVTLANIFQLIAGSGDDMKINLYGHPVSETFLQPMVDYIRSHGGKVLYNIDVQGFEKEGDLIVRVITGEVPDELGNVRRCAVCGNLILDGQERDDECPFCGANIEMAQMLTPQERGKQIFEADFFVSAVDIPAAKQIVNQNISVLGDSPYFRNILDLKTQSVYVTTLWFDGKGFWEEHVKDETGTRPGICFFATGFKYLGITINRSVRINFPDRKFTISPELADRDLTFIETQIADAQSVTGKSTQEIADLCHEELKSVIPNLPPYRDAYVNRWHHYNGYGVGIEAKRPPIQSPIDNLLFIGDMAFVAHPAVFMEKTNVTAKTATNILLDKCGITEGKIKILMSGTPSVAVDALKAVTSVYI
ncbi:Hypothetical protein HDN1F_18440 [gamma proteobacterium HdN1]|nr:Hypothetical protein HDN1F_18440 [gamma proteobacterium HdN1]